MAFCGECGNRIPDNSVVCPVCGTPVQRSNPIPPEPNPQNDRYTSYLQKEFVLAQEEEVVREYQCSEIKVPQCHGYVTVTNKRLIFHGTNESSRVSKEVILDAVSGLDCYYGWNINILGVILGVLFCLVGLISFAKASTEYPSEAVYGLFIIFLGSLILYFSIKKAFFMSVFSSKTSDSPIKIGRGATNMLGNGALYTLVSEPSKDTDRMLNELGALIQDLQTLGDRAIDLWA